VLARQALHARTGRGPWSAWAGPGLALLSFPRASQALVSVAGVLRPSSQVGADGARSLNLGEPGSPFPPAASLRFFLSGSL
jgi:hypothetical protein